MGFKCGIVGLPNVGKSTLFNALTHSSVPAHNYPFCTIDPHVGIVDVPDVRLTHIAQLAQARRMVPTTVEFVDIAGLVSGAAQGEGLGNRFLAHIRETDAIAHIVRGFDHDQIVHVHGHVDPVADIETIHTELACADLECIDRTLLKLKKERSTDRLVSQKIDVLEQARVYLNEGNQLRHWSCTEEQNMILSHLHLLTHKPEFYVVNVTESKDKNNAYIQDVTQYAHQKGSAVVVVCAALESELSDLTHTEQEEFLKDLGWQEIGLHRVIRAGYHTLGLETFFTAGVQEARAWTIQSGTKAPQAAAVIHSDFEKGFIRAEVISYDDYVQFNGECGAKSAGKWRLEGKEYIVQDGDILLFRFQV